jgi:hypothetical protein
MTTTHGESFNHRQRSAAGCLCCGSPSLNYETQVISGFLAQRAWDGPPEVTQLVSCTNCEVRFFDRGLTPTEATRYYRNYRDPKYVSDRQRWEPFYTAGQHAAQVKWSHAPERVAALRAALAASPVPTQVASVLDHGGAHGHMLAAIDATRKAVFDLSGQNSIESVELFHDGRQLPENWELILSCQVLEHVSSPLDYLTELHRRLASTGWLYLEVPIETWRSARGDDVLRESILQFLVRHPRMLIAADVLCTVSRIKLGALPPFGFIAMREHLNYFSESALQHLLERAGFSVPIVGINSVGQRYVIAHKTRI